MARQTHAARFADLQGTARKTADATRQARIRLQGKYGSLLNLHCYGRAADRQQLDRLERAERKAWDRFYAHLQTCSPRAWATGFPIGWLRDSLTYADACTRGQMAQTPPPAFGYSDRDAAELAAPLTEHPTG